jgi:hypothetical protein
MQCPSCGFQNLPGLTACARCTGVLDFSGLDVHPYRASQHFVRLRHWQWLRRHRHVPLLHARLGAFFRGQWERTGLGRRNRAPGEPLLRERLTWTGASILLPGLGQTLSGRRRRGFVLMGGFFLLLLLSLEFMASAGPFFMAMAVGMHAYAITECVFYRDGFFPRWEPVLISVLIFIVLRYMVYDAAGWALNGVVRVEPLALAAPSRLLEPGDVLAVQGRWLAPARYRPGQIVSYTIAGASGSGWYIRPGTSVDRILAGPGDRVAIRNRTILVNGQPLPRNRGLLTLRPLPSTYEAIIPSDSYFIYPTLPDYAVQHGHPNVSEEAVRLEISVVPVDRIQGKVIGIVGPLERIGRIEVQ